MPNWKQLLDELKERGSAHDIVRREYLEKLHKHTGRNVIAYYSGWLQKGALTRQGVGFDINDSDKNGFMTTIHELQRGNGLDLILHTPGGSGSVLESLVDYLRQMFGTDIRAIVPQLAMSAGTMLALACKEILMGKHSNLGPIDPLLGGLSAHGILDEFEQAKQEAQTHQFIALMWQPIIAKYHPTLLGRCKQAIQWSETITRGFLKTGMFLGDKDADAKIDRVMKELAIPANTLGHDRHISMKQATDMGLNVKAIETDATLQDLVLSVHHCFIQTLSATPAFKIIENHKGVAFIQQVQQTIVAMQGE